MRLRRDSHLIQPSILIRSAVFFGVTSYSLVRVYRRFEGAFRFYQMTLHRYLLPLSSGLDERVIRYLWKVSTLLADYMTLHVICIFTAMTVRIQMVMQFSGEISDTTNKRFPIFTHTLFSIFLTYKKNRQVLNKNIHISWTQNCSDKKSQSTPSHPVYTKLILRIVLLCTRPCLPNVVFLSDSQLKLCKNVYVVLSAAAISLHIIQNVHKNPIRILKMHNITPKAGTNIQSFLCFLDRALLYNCII